MAIGILTLLFVAISLISLIGILLLFLWSCFRHDTCFFEFTKLQKIRIQANSPVSRYVELARMCLPGACPVLWRGV